VSKWVVLGAAAVATAMACSDTNVQILTGQLYNAQGACLGPVSGVDVVSGGGSDGCPAECLLANAGEAGVVAYISTTCPPVSADYTTENQDQARDASDPCFGAFAAYEAGAMCSADGGAPEAGPEASADASADGASDGGVDGASQVTGDAAQDALGTD
jgi:hypothetical protein